MPLLRNKFPAVPPTPYAELRPRLQSGDVLLCSGTGVFSNLIQRATRSVWSHVALVMRLEGIDRVMVLESVEPIGVRTVRLSKYLTNYANDGKPYPGRLAVIRHNEFQRSEGRGQPSTSLRPGRLREEREGSREKEVGANGDGSATLRSRRGEGGQEHPAHPPQADTEIRAPVSSPHASLDTHHSSFVTPEVGLRPEGILYPRRSRSLIKLYRCPYSCKFGQYDTQNNIKNS